jgi:hypothetical protein
VDVFDGLNRLREIVLAGKHQTYPVERTLVT